jgi:SAM-dependent methyltransferase
MNSEKEIDRIKRAYEVRKKIPSLRYSFLNHANSFMVQRRTWELLRMLKKFGIDSLEDNRILDVGCGTCGKLRNLVHYGALPENCLGIDLLPDGIAIAQKISSYIEFKCGNYVGIIKRRA